MDTKYRKYQSFINTLSSAQQSDVDTVVGLTTYYSLTIVCYELIYNTLSNKKKLGSNLKLNIGLLQQWSIE